MIERDEDTVSDTPSADSLCRETDGRRFVIRKATVSEFDSVVRMIDTNLTKIGHGFVNKMQLLTEIERGSVSIAEKNGSIVGVRVGKSTLWNLVVDEAHRGQGIGSALLRFGNEPHTVRVKCKPTGNMSKYQRERFIDPRGFYERNGYFHWGWSTAKNFWQRGRSGERANFHKQSKHASISVYKKRGETLFE